jgi:hypothetical protein
MTRKPRRARWAANPNAMTSVITGVLPTPENLLERQRMTELQAIEAFAKGHATPDDFRALCDVLNVAETFARYGIGPEVMPVCETVQEVLLLCKAEFDESGAMSVHDDELEALRTLYALHDLQRQCVDWAGYAKMIEKTANRIRSAHPDVKELA